MHKDSTAQAKQKKDEREEVLKEIRQLENRQKILENKMCIRDRSRMSLSQYCHSTARWFRLRNSPDCSELV